MPDQIYSQSIFSQLQAFGRKEAVIDNCPNAVLKRIIALYNTIMHDATPITGMQTKSNNQATNKIAEKISAIKKVKSTY